MSMSNGVFFGIRSAYVEKPRVQIVFPESSLTKQSFRDECDVNLIVDRFSRSGVLPDSSGAGRWGDATAPDLQDALNFVIQAQHDFNALPAVMRKRFNNDPLELVSFIDDVSNRDEAVRMGLIEPPKPSEGVSPSASAAEAATPVVVAL